MQQESQSFDLVIYGGTGAAVTAAVQARRMGKTVAVVCPERHLGGLTASGLGWTDSKKGSAIGGLAREFYERVYRHYQGGGAWRQESRDDYLARKVGAQPGPAIDESRKVMWTFEPHAAERVFEAWLAEEKVPVFRGEYLDRGPKGVEKRGARLVAIRTRSGKRFAGRMFLDAGYEGDLMAAAGVRYRVGRDSAREYDEPLNGVRFAVKGVDRYHGDDEYAGVSPFVKADDPKSGLLPGIEAVWEPGRPMPLGEADPVRLQSFNFRLCLTQDRANRVPIERPAGYDEREFELLFRLFAAGRAVSFTTQAMPNRKTDSNNQGRMSGDFVGGNFSAREGWTYSEASDDRRRQIVDAHRRYQQGLMWTLQNHPRIPEATRKRLGVWGLSKDEFAANGHWPYQLYIREARRMEGVATVTQHHVQRRPGFAVKDPIGLGSYSLDSHVVRRLVVDGAIRDEGGFYVWWDKPYPLPFGCILPRRNEASNLLVPITVSATHAAFGSIRMEPTYLLLGQAAATAAVLALDSPDPDAAVQDVPYPALAARLKRDGQVLEG